MTQVVNEYKTLPMINLLAMTLIEVDSISVKKLRKIAKKIDYNLMWSRQVRYKRISKDTPEILKAIEKYPDVFVIHGCEIKWKHEQPNLSIVSCREDEDSRIERFISLQDMYENYENLWYPYPEDVSPHIYHTAKKIILKECS